MDGDHSECRRALAELNHAYSIFELRPYSQVVYVSVAWKPSDLVRSIPHEMALESQEWMQLEGVQPCSSLVLQ